MIYRNGKHLGADVPRFLVSLDPGRAGVNARIVERVPLLKVLELAERAYDSVCAVAASDQQEGQAVSPDDEAAEALGQFAEDVAQEFRELLFQFCGARDRDDGTPGQYFLLSATDSERVAK